MAFANLTELTLDQYRALNASFNATPTSSKSGTPDTRITVALGGWASQTLMKFTVQTAGGASSSLGIVDPDNQTVTVTVADAAAGPMTTTYWSVECGATDSRETDWSVNFNVMANNRSTGTWVFRKGTTVDPS